MNKVFTRKQYLNKEITHREYYAQFVNEDVKRMVLNQFTIDELRQSFEKDEFFNTKLTPIKKWDQIAGFLFSPTTGETLMKPTTMRPVDPKLIKEAGEWFSSATAVCIYKEAGRQIIGK